MSSLPVDLHAAITNEIVRGGSTQPATDQDDAFEQQLRETEPIPASPPQPEQAETVPVEDAEPNPGTESSEDQDQDQGATSGEADREDVIQEEDVADDVTLAIEQAQQARVVEETVQETPLVVQDTPEQLTVKAVTTEDEQASDSDEQIEKTTTVDLQPQTPNGLRDADAGKAEDRPVTLHDDLEANSVIDEGLMQEALAEAIDTGPSELVGAEVESRVAVINELPQVAIESPAKAKAIDGEQAIIAQAEKKQPGESILPLPDQPEQVKAVEPTTPESNLQRQPSSAAVLDDGAPAPVDPNISAGGDQAIDPNLEAIDTAKPAASLREQIGKPLSREEETSGLTRVQNARFINRVARAFESAQLRDEPVRIRLSPPELGSMKIEIKVESGGLTARVETETAGARNAIVDNLAILKDRLSEQGMKIEQFDVDVTDRQPEPDQPDEDQARDRSKRANEELNEGIQDTDRSEEDDPGDGNLNLVA